MDKLKNISALQLFEPPPEAVYTIDAAAHLTHMPRHEIGVWFLRGVVSPAVDPECDVCYLDKNAIRTLQRINYLRSVYHTDFTSTQLVLNLMDEVEHLRNEVRTLRQRSRAEQKHQKEE